MRKKNTELWPEGLDSFCTITCSKGFWTKMASLPFWFFLLILNLSTHHWCLDSYNNSLRNLAAPTPLCRKQCHICPLFASRTPGWCKVNLIWFHPSPEIGWSWRAAPFFSYGNNLEGGLVSALWWPCNSKCSAISVHRFTFSQNTGITEDTGSGPFSQNTLNAEPFKKRWHSSITRHSLFVLPMSNTNSHSGS